MIIRKATMSDFETIKEIYAYARSFMAKTGNPNQWGTSKHPSDEFIKNDILNNTLCVVEENSSIKAVFSLHKGIDPSYIHIDGKWLNDEPYVAVHSVAAAKGSHGMFDFIMDYVKSKYDNIKIDTHHDNKIMQHLLTSRGFVYCGIIHVTNGDFSPRMAYQYSKK